MQGDIHWATFAPHCCAPRVGVNRPNLVKPCCHDGVRGSVPRVILGCMRVHMYVERPGTQSHGNRSWRQLGAGFHENPHLPRQWQWQRQPCEPGLRLSPRKLGGYKPLSSYFNRVREHPANPLTPTGAPAVDRPGSCQVFSLVSLPPMSMSRVGQSLWPALSCACVLVTGMAWCSE